MGKKLFLKPRRAAAASGISIDIQTNVTSGPGPLVVWFDATATTAAGVTYPLHELIYVWDFDDVGAGSWSYGNPIMSSKETDIGFITGHVFEAAGTYNVTLTVYDATGTNAPASAGVTITVTDRDTWFTQTGREIVYVSNTNNFTGAIAAGPHANGGTVTHLNTSTWTTAMAEVGADKLVLFRRGETWSVSSLTTFNANAAWWGIGAFASGALPLMNVLTTGTVFKIGGTGGYPQNGVIADLKMDGGPGDAIAYDRGCTNVSLLRITATAFGDACIAMSYTSCDDIQSLPGADGLGSGALFEGAHIVDCDFLGQTTSSKFYALHNCHKSLLMGNRIDRTIDGSQGVMRSWFSQKNCLAHNYVAHSPGATQTWKVNGWQNYVKFASANTTTDELQVDTATYGVGGGNTFNENNIRVQVFEDSPGSLPSPLVDGNTYWIVAVSGTENENMKLGTTRGGAAIDLTTSGSGRISNYPSLGVSTYLFHNCYIANHIRIGKAVHGLAFGKGDDDDCVRGSNYDNLFEGNFHDLYEDGAVVVTTGLALRGYHERLTVRNEIFLSRYDDGFSTFAVQHSLPLTQNPMGPLSLNVWIDGITAYNNIAGWVGKLWGLNQTDARGVSNFRVRNYLGVSLSAAANTIAAIDDDSLSVIDDGGHHTRKGTPGTVFVSSDPTTPAEFRLAAASPAIAQGVNGNTTYMDQERRVRGATVDSGALEFVGV